MAPTVKYGDQIIVESGAIIETILESSCAGQAATGTRQSGLSLPPDVDALRRGLARLPTVFRLSSLAHAAAATSARGWWIPKQWCSSPKTISAKHPWFGGAEFSAADIMMMFPLNVATALNIVDVAQFPNVAAWKTKIEARPAYKRMLAKARPDGMVGSLPALPQHAPSGPRKP